jgi:hypothetical protein
MSERLANQIRVGRSSYGARSQPPRPAQCGPLVRTEDLFPRNDRCVQEETPLGHRAPVDGCVVSLDRVDHLAVRRGQIEILRLARFPECLWVLESAMRISNYVADTVPGQTKHR